MLRSVLEFFQTELSDHFKMIGVEKSNIDFPSPNVGSQESINFADNALNLMLINFEEENTLRKADIFRQEKNGNSYPVSPEIRLSLYLLFIANRSDYLTSMDLLSLVIRYFQSRRVFDKSTSPGLSDEIQRLTVELVTLPISQQNEVWNALRTSYKPSVLYKVKMVTFRSEEPLLEAPEITEIKHNLNA